MQWNKETNSCGYISNLMVPFYPSTFQKVYIFKTINIINCAMDAYFRKPGRIQGFLKYAIPQMVKLADSPGFLASKKKLVLNSGQIIVI